MRVIHVFGCGSCPFNGGWDLWHSAKIGYEEIVCHYRRRVLNEHGLNDKDLIIGKFDRNKYKQTTADLNKDHLLDIPIPKWCPLDDVEYTL